MPNAFTVWKNAFIWLEKTLKTSYKGPVSRLCRFHLPLTIGVLRAPRSLPPWTRWHRGCLVTSGGHDLAAASLLYRPRWPPFACLPSEFMLHNQTLHITLDSLVWHLRQSSEGWPEGCEVRGSHVLPWEKGSVLKERRDGQWAAQQGVEVTEPAMGEQDLWNEAMSPLCQYQLRGVDCAILQDVTDSEKSWTLMVSERCVCWDTLQFHVNNWTLKPWAWPVLRWEWLLTIPEESI
ncbi:hypothetical protein PR048_012643 [Dryococelus australis]|uniref:Uncharacterized protein n=1 Tax=Dryococelus australis TaxID=614101 RepID=A0ABQ9HQC6_9NEOP|nr:hypothetical protein PR048_012643 [Dryococelus australis]